MFGHSPRWNREWQIDFSFGYSLGYCGSTCSSFIWFYPSYIPLFDCYVSTEGVEGHYLFQTVPKESPTDQIAIMLIQEVNNCPASMLPYNDVVNIGYSILWLLINDESAPINMLFWACSGRFLHQQSAISIFNGGKLSRWVDLGPSESLVWGLHQNSTQFCRLLYPLFLIHVSCIHGTGGSESGRR